MGRFPGGADDCLSLFLAVGAVISGNAWLSKSQMGHEQRGTVRPVSICCCSKQAGSEHQEGEKHLCDPAGSRKVIA